MFKRVFKRVFKRKARIEVSTETMAETLALLNAARREMIWFEIENEEQQRIRDYLFEQMGIILDKLCEEYLRG